MFAKLLKSQWSMVLCMLLVVGLAALSMGEPQAALVEVEGDATCDLEVSTPPEGMLLADSEHANAACRPGCVGPCWFCLLGVCENRCM
ncbi:hypothetical protein HUA74_38625 [Myxococcus sp. CA051A]|uniref:hypothetical protein n=1 Tax=unclassified Myxococcus TaxID=2648731 RepID=UPI00157B61DF|nr:MULTISPECIES: hypothetical protein [unclassified Myxococcus]NTX07090.1 hypothetical protein [Myxococcus sp. CA040A]NTX17424.1 hypothetical protein [Myxococcus sp. CA056]NTX39003.1 hypothetical protein [Myxococcus sp. CA033]NTX57523.1 hypothetical protein [Myxococcus sp. CA039A]NTX66581.1 hypothetical protein [Myxococcus sp. CA051A]